MKNHSYHFRLYPLGLVCVRSSEAGCALVTWSVHGLSSSLILDRHHNTPSRFDYLQIGTVNVHILDLGSYILINARETNTVVKFCIFRLAKLVYRPQDCVRLNVNKKPHSCQILPHRKITPYY